MDISTSKVKARRTSLNKKSSEELIQIILRKDATERKLSSTINNYKITERNLERSLNNYKQAFENSIENNTNLGKLVDKVKRLNKKLKIINVLIFILLLILILKFLLMNGFCIS